ncbi:MAG: hypothetical protein IJN87_08165 [Firmicutes bacterium]|nr:hypothetical protein [Bacillota bacterium]
MTDFRKLYFKLFAAIADAVEDLENGCLTSAKEKLINVQQEAEEEYLAGEED